MPAVRSAIDCEPPPAGACACSGMARKNHNKSGVTTLVNVFVITSSVLQNLYDTRNTTVRGVCIEVGARNCGSVCFAPVTPLVNVVAAVSVRVAHTHDA